MVKDYPYLINPMDSGTGIEPIIQVIKHLYYNGSWAGSRNVGEGYDVTKQYSHLLKLLWKKIREILKEVRHSKI